MFNYQSLGDNMSALRANQKTQVLILHGVYFLVPLLFLSPPF